MLKPLNLEGTKKSYQAGLKLERNDAGAQWWYIQVKWNRTRVAYLIQNQKRRKTMFQVQNNDKVV